MKHLKITLITLLVLGLVSFTVFQTLQEDRDLIIGTWIPEGSPNYKSVFTQDGKLYEYYEGNIDKTYRYNITESRSSNGRVFSYLKIINIDDSNDVYTYDINGISKKEMYLDYLGDMNTKLLKYTRQ